MMKNFFSNFIINGIGLLSFGFINPDTNATQKVLDTFNQSFNEVKNVRWINSNKEYTAIFQQDDIRTSMTYDKDGRFLFSRRYYNEDHLPFNLLLKIKEKYKGKTIKIVTEVIQDDTIMYSVNLEDEENLYYIESSSNTNIKVQSKFKKQVL